MPQQQTHKSVCIPTNRENIATNSHIYPTPSTTTPKISPVHLSSTNKSDLSPPPNSSRPGKHTSTAQTPRLTTQRRMASPSSSAGRSPLPLNLSCVTNYNTRSNVSNSTSRKANTSLCRH